MPQGALTLTNTYGADGLRKASWPGTWNGTTRRYDAGAKTFYIYSGDTLIGEIAANGTPTAAYTWGAAGLISAWHWSTGLNLFYHYGPQGETRTLTDASGNIRDTDVYTPYGYPVTSTGTDANPFQFGGSVGYYTDQLAQGLILCDQRWYSPGWARWLSRDPAGYAGGADLYAYCGGNPVGSSPVWVRMPAQCYGGSARRYGASSASNSSAQRSCSVTL